MFCATHMRAKHSRIWADFNPSVKRKIIKIQAVWRRFLVQRILGLAGKGVLCRKHCHNEDELVTSDSKDKIHPFDYFSIEEDGKLWWFDQKSMIDWSEKNIEITNPFTRTVLSPNDCRRLRKLRMHRIRKNMPITHSETDTRTKEEHRDIRWLRIVQIINECGMDETVHPNDCIGMETEQYIEFMGKLVEQVKNWMYVRDEDQCLVRSRRWKYFCLLRVMRNTIHTYLDEISLSNDISGLILGCLNDMSDPTEFVFFILSALVSSDVLAADL